MLGIDHEKWSCQIILSPETEVHQKLTDPRVAISPSHVTALIEKDNHQRPPWQKTLLSSELDVDRLDYLQRDSYFTGAKYGHYDWYRILNSFELHEGADGLQVLVWPEKTMYAIEEYIFSRFYMYHNVYQHKTTRGFEKLLHAAWGRAKWVAENKKDPWYVHEVAEFLTTKPPTVKQYLAMDDATMLYQLRVWARHPDETLRDLATRFLVRDGLAVIEDPVGEAGFGDERQAWESALYDIVVQHGHKPPECYALRDDLKLTVYNPYLPEKEDIEQDPYNAIMIKPTPRTAPQEISRLLHRPAPVTGVRPKQHRYYVPKDVRDDARSLAERQRW